MSAIPALASPLATPSAVRAEREVSEVRHSASQVAVTRTPSTPGQIRRALAEALEKRGESRPELLEVLVAHVAHETANGQRMYNFNFGGIKGASPEGHVAQFRTHEQLSGRRVALRDGFRAYRSIAEGAEDYVAFLSTRYGEALDAAAEGGPTAFAAALAKGRYYTDSPARYARALERHYQAQGGSAFASDALPPPIELRLLGGAPGVGMATPVGPGSIEALPTLGVVRAIYEATSMASRLAVEGGDEGDLSRIDEGTFKGRDEGPFDGAIGELPGPSGRRNLIDL